MSSRTSSLRWIVNGPMLYGALLGYLVISSVLGLFSTASHEGSGLIYYDEGEPRKAPEGEYKRHKYFQYGLMLGVSGVLWVFVASALRKQVALAAAEKEWEAACRKESLARFSAFAEAVDSETRQLAYAHADSSADYQNARRISEEARWIYNEALMATRPE